MKYKLPVTNMKTKTRVIPKIFRVGDKFLLEHHRFENRSNKVNKKPRRDNILVQGIICGGTAHRRDQIGFSRVYSVTALF